MTTAVEIKRWTRPIWEARQDVVLRERTLTIAPFTHVRRMIDFEDSSDRTDRRQPGAVLLIIEVRIGE